MKIVAGLSGCDANQSFLDDPSLHGFSDSMVIDVEFLDADEMLKKHGNATILKCLKNIR